MLANRIREHRQARGWSQFDLARHSGLSRPEVSAIETGRVVPSTHVALSLGRALGASVETLFSLAAESAVSWAWAPPGQPGRVWCARVGARRLSYPCEPGALGLISHDATCTTSAPVDAAAQPTLVIAGCDPAVGLLRDALVAERLRVLAFTRSSRRALSLLREGVVHVAGVHLSPMGDQTGNAQVVREMLGPGYRLVHVATWDAGLALAAGISPGKVSSKHLAGLRWIGREEGSGARRCLDDLLEGRQAPGLERIAADHREVAQMIRIGVADAGMCIRLAAAEAALQFISVRSESYDLCFRDEMAEDPSIHQLLKALQSTAFRRRLNELPGYSGIQTGDVATVT